MGYLTMLFSQKATWNEVIPSDSSLSEETTEVHALDCVRVSVETVGNGGDTNGYRSNSGAVLYYLIGKSTCDGKDVEPVFKAGDTIETPNHVWTVVSVSEYSSLIGGKHHLEVGME